MMERKAQWSAKNCLLQNMKQMAVWNLLLAWRFRTLVRTKSWYVPRIFDKALQEAFYKSSYRGDWWVRSVKVYSTRKIYTEMCKRQNSRWVRVHWQFSSDNKAKDFWGYAGRNLKTFLLQVQVLVNQDFRLARRINIINGKSINSIYTV